MAAMTKDGISMTAKLGRPHFGLQIADFRLGGNSGSEMFESLVRVTQSAEATGFDSVWVMDHFQQKDLFGGPSSPLLEPYSLLAALAARTKLASLGTLVSAATHRPPAALAKIVTTLDIISSGRAILGVGAGWDADEHRRYGIGDKVIGTRERLERLEETLHICKKMFRNEVTSFRGQYYQIEDAYNAPAPVQKEGPPILVAGLGERRTLRLVARYADMSNFSNTSPDVSREKLRVLAEHCEEVGRDPEDVLKTRVSMLVMGETLKEAKRKRSALYRAWKSDSGGHIYEYAQSNPEVVLEQMIWGGPEQVRDQIAAYLDIGFDGLIFVLPDSHDEDIVRLVGDTLVETRRL